MNGFYRFYDYGYNIEYNERYNKNIDDFVPMLIANYFGVQQAMNFFFGLVVHLPLILVA